MKQLGTRPTTDTPRIILRAALNAERMFPLK